MLFQAKCRWLETFDRMTGLTCSTVRAFRKLSTVRIGPVTVHAFLKRERLFKISSSMALRTRDCGMFSKQRELRLGVVEALTHGRYQDLFPSGRVVARLAGLHKATFVRVAMAIRAFSEGNAGVAGLIVGSGGVALLARYLNVLAGQWITCLGVVELANRNRFPVIVVVAL